MNFHSALIVLQHWHFVRQTSHRSRWDDMLCRCFSNTITIRQQVAMISQITYITNEICEEIRWSLRGALSLQLKLEMHH